jgi:hypothetical protein
VVQTIIVSGPLSGGQINFKLKAMIILGFIHRDRAVERIGIAPRAHLPPDQYFRYLAFVGLGHLPEECDRLFERICKPLA